MTFNDIQFNTLKENAEWFFDSVLHHSTIRSAPRAVTELVAQTYEDATGAKLNKNYSCANCVMNIYRLVGTVYYQDKEEREKNTNRQDDRGQIHIQGAKPESSRKAKEGTKVKPDSRKGKARR